MAKKKNTKKKRPEKKIAKGVFAIIAIIFISILASYFLTDKENVFEHNGLNWNIGTRDGIDTYYTNFPILNNKNLNYNIYLTKDPRENNVSIDGEFRNFKDKAYISLSSELESCGWETSKSLSDLEDFLKHGTGARQINFTTSDAELALETGEIERYKNCFNVIDRTVIMIDIGENSVVQESSNKFCYIIKINDCRDISSIEKFMTEVAERSQSDSQ